MGGAHKKDDKHPDVSINRIRYWYSEITAINYISALLKRRCDGKSFALSEIKINEQEVFGFAINFLVLTDTPWFKICK